VRWGASDRQVEDLWAQTVEHPYFDAYWRSKVADFSAIDVPAYVVASWSDHGVHTRGTLEGFKGLSLPAPMAGNPRREEVGLLLRAIDRAADSLFRSLP
jgi:predicted acyl esterase